MRKESVSLSILVPILVLVMTALAGAIIWVVLSPYFGTQLRAPISAVPCGTTHPALHQQEYPDPSKPPPSSITRHLGHSPVISSSTEQCYRAEDVIGLNKALNISDTISLVGLLLAIFAFIAPIFSYLTLRKERKYLEHSIQEELKKSTDLLQNTIVTLINPLPLILQSIEVFKSAYQTDVYQRVNRSATEPHEISIQSSLSLDQDISIKNEAETLHSMRRSATDAHEIASRLLSLLNLDTLAKDVFSQIESYITDSSVMGGARHIQMLKMVIRQLYDSSYLGSDERKAALSDFLKGTLKISPEDFKRGT